MEIVKIVNVSQLRKTNISCMSLAAITTNGNHSTCVDADLRANLILIKKSAIRRKSTQMHSNHGQTEWQGGPSSDCLLFISRKISILYIANLASGLISLINTSMNKVIAVFRIARKRKPAKFKAPDYVKDFLHTKTDTTYRLRSQDRNPLFSVPRTKHMTFNKLTSVFHASVLLLMMNFVITLLQRAEFRERGYRQSLALFTLSSTINQRKFISIHLQMARKVTVSKFNKVF